MIDRDIPMIDLEDAPSIINNKDALDYINTPDKSEEDDKLSLQVANLASLPIIDILRNREGKSHKELLDELMLQVEHGSDNEIWLSRLSRNIISDVLYTLYENADRVNKVAKVVENLKTLQAKLSKYERKINEYIFETPEARKAVEELVAANDRSYAVNKKMFKLGVAVEVLEKGEDLYPTDKDLRDLSARVGSTPEALEKEIKEFVETRITTDNKDKLKLELEAEIKQETLELENAMNNRSEKEDPVRSMLRLEKDLQQDLREDLEQSTIMRLETLSYDNKSFVGKIQTFFRNFLIHIENRIFHNGTHFKRTINSISNEGSKRLKEAMEPKTKAGAFLTFERRNEVKKMLDDKYSGVIADLNKVGPRKTIESEQRKMDYDRDSGGMKACRKHILLALYARLDAVETEITQNMNQPDEARMIERDRLSKSIHSMENDYFTMLQSASLGILYLMQGLDKARDLRGFTDELVQNIETFQRNQDALDKKGEIATDLAKAVYFDASLIQLASTGPDGEWKAIKQYASEQAASMVFPEFIKPHDEYYHEDNFQTQQVQLGKLTGVKIESIPETKYGSDFMIQHEDVIKDVAEQNIEKLDSAINKLKLRIDKLKSIQSPNVGITKIMSNTMSSGHSR